MVTLQQLVAALQNLTNPSRVSIAATTNGWVRLELPKDQYDAAVRAVASLSLADMMNEHRAIAAFPKLVTACQLVLAIEDEPFAHHGERVKLAPKTRKQIEKALKVAGREIPR